MKLLLFGSGLYYERSKKYFKNHEIVGILDNDVKKIATIIDGVNVYSPKDGVKKEFDKIFILTETYYTEMKNQLISLGVSEEKICGLYDIKNIINYTNEALPITIYSTDKNYIKLFKKDKPNIAILTVSLGINGGDMTVLYAAKALSERYNIHIISSMDGPLRPRFSEIRDGIPVIIDESIIVKSVDELSWLKYYDMILVNGMTFFTLFEKDYTSDVNAIWWIHSSGSMNDNIPLNRINSVPQKNISVYGVSHRAIESFKEQVTSWNIGYLCYGVQDKFTGTINTRTDKIIFALVGSLNIRKAQDIFIEAILKLSKEKRNMCEFWLMGNVNGSFANKILKRIEDEDIDCIEYLGIIDNETMLNEIYPQISVLVCPSREDTMPIVCAEAMMFNHPCIVSDHTGTAAHIEPKENGLICKVDDVNDLNEKIKWMIDNKDKISEMGKAARKIYEKYYTVEQFETKLSDIVEKKLKQ